MRTKNIITVLLAAFLALPSYCSFAEKNEDDTTGKSTVPQVSAETETVHEQDGKDIVQWNKDILDAVYASSYYGIHAEGRENYKKKLSILVTTDVHGHWDRLGDAVRYLNAIPSLDGGCCLGDILINDFTESADAYTDVVHTSQKPWLTVIGNHDCGNSYNPELAGTTEQIVEKLITPNEDLAAQTGLTVPYYYYDWDHYGIRFIILYNFESPYDKKDEDTLVIRRGADCYDQEQLNWLVSTLNHTPAGYAVVILQHAQPENSLQVDCSFSQPYIIPRGNGTGCYGRASIKGDIVDAWIKGTAFIRDYEPEPQYAGILPTLSISADFTERGPGEFICYLVGHEHADCVTRLTEHPEQITIAFAATADGNYLNAGSDLPRVKGDRSEDAITVVSFDTSFKRINLVRIGSTKTIYMVDRTMVSIPYMYY